MANSNIRWPHLMFVETFSYSRFMRLSVQILAVNFAIGICSTALGQHRHFYPGNNAMMMYLNQVNKMNAEEKQSATGEAKERIRQAEPKINACKAQRANLSSDLEAAKRKLKSCEKSVAENQSALREARSQRSNLETQLLAAQTENSSYRIALNAIRKAEDESLKRAEKVVQHPLKNGNPVKLQVMLKTKEYQALEKDVEWVGVFRRYEEAKKRLADEVDRLVTKDKPISKLDESIGRLANDRKTLDAELAAAKKTKSGLANSLRELDAELEIATNDRDTAQMFLAQLNGK
jgi:chromosome segregation ATPase